MFNEHLSTETEDMVVSFFKDSGFEVAYLSWSRMVWLEMDEQTFDVTILLDGLLSLRILGLGCLLLWIDVCPLSYQVFVY